MPKPYYHVHNSPPATPKMYQINRQSLYHLDATAILHKSHSNEKCNILQKMSFPQTYCFAEVK